MAITVDSDAYRRLIQNDLSNKGAIAGIKTMNTVRSWVCNQDISCAVINRYSSRTFQIFTNFPLIHAFGIKNFDYSIISIANEELFIVGQCLSGTKKMSFSKNKIAVLLT